MTPPDLEQAARVVINQLTQIDANWGCCLSTTEAVQVIMNALATTRRQALLEAAEVAVREECETDDPINHACRIAHSLRQQAER